jgi:anthranilate synthase/aminodeoxychorismate synthase-like glutamine amidotransferase
MSRQILLIDNYDSFVYNLARYFQRLGQPTIVVRNDALTVDQIRAQQPAAIVLSPGPCSPQQAGCSVDVVRQLADETAILGVCLGHQAIAAALGGNVMRAAQVMHGRTSEVLHDGRGIFAGLPNPLVACRYHSLVVEEASLPACLKVTARTRDGVVMALEHRDKPVVGVQFHPESILTESGYILLANFLQIAGIDLPAVLPSIDSEREVASESATHWPTRPVTF